METGEGDTRRWGGGELPARPVEQVALQVAVVHAQVVAVALLAADNRVKAVRHPVALVAVLADHARRTNALAGTGLARGRRRAIARLAVREPEVACLARGALPADDVRPTLALASIRVAHEAQRALRVALARHGTAVVRGGQRERGVFAKACGQNKNLYGFMPFHDCEVGKGGAQSRARFVYPFCSVRVAREVESQPNTRMARRREYDKCHVDVTRRQAAENFRPIPVQHYGSGLCRRPYRNRLVLYTSDFVVKQIRLY